MFSLMVPENRLFSLHCRLSFAPFLITNLIMRTRRAPAFPLFSLHLRLIYFASLLFLHFCMQCHVGFFPISTSVSHLWNERRYTIAFKKISHYRNTFLPVFHYFPITLRSHARLILGGKRLPFFFFINVVLLVLAFFFLSSVCRVPQFSSFYGIAVHFAVALDYGVRAFTTRPCANIFYVFKVCCSYVDSSVRHFRGQYSEMLFL